MKVPRPSLPSMLTLLTEGRKSRSAFEYVWVGLDVLTEEVKSDNTAEERTEATVGGGASTQEKH